jgi:hypothetical protein
VDLDVVYGFGGPHVCAVGHGFPVVSEVQSDMFLAHVVYFGVVHYVNALIAVCYDGSDVDDAHYGVGDS